MEMFLYVVVGLVLLGLSFLVTKLLNIDKNTKQGEK